MRLLLPFLLSVGDYSVLDSTLCNFVPSSSSKELITIHCSPVHQDTYPPLRGSSFNVQVLCIRFFGMSVDASVALFQELSVVDFGSLWICSEKCVLCSG